MAEVAEVLDLTPAYVKGVVTFYTMYHTPPGRPALHPGLHHVALQRLRRGGRGEGVPASRPAAASSAPPVADGQFTVIEVECLGACGFATPIMINDDFIEIVTPEKVPEHPRRG